jgi:hypothetical protein
MFCPTPLSRDPLAPSSRAITSLMKIRTSANPLFLVLEVQVKLTLLSGKNHLKEVPEKSLEILADLRVVTPEPKTKTNLKDLASRLTSSLSSTGPRPWTSSSVASIIHSKSSGMEVSLTSLTLSSPQRTTRYS